MKKILSILALSTLVFANKSTAQTWVNDSVSMSTGKVNDVYYSCANGTVKTENNQNWILAFSMGSQTAGVWANHINGVSVLNPHKSAASWASITLADTAISAVQLNSETSWGNGALNVNKNPGAQFDFGWGTYDLVSHNVFGDSIFIIGKGGSYYKFIIDSLDGNNQIYYTRIGGLSQPIPTLSYTFAKSPKYSKSNMLYVTLGQGLKDTMRDADNTTFEMIFTKYMGLTSLQGGGQAIYPLVGVLSNSKILSTPVQNPNFDVVLGANGIAALTLTKTINNIGANWKTFDGTAYTIAPDLSYVVKGVDSNYYQIMFTGYTSSTGLIKFAKRKINFPTAISTVGNNKASMQIAPNPVANNAVVVLESTIATTANMQIVNTQGQILYNAPITINAALNAFNINTNNLTAGQYFVNIIGANIKITQAITKQ
jgi:HmuY protein/Secretion system C-terminal sorting domain